MKYNDFTFGVGPWRIAVTPMYEKEHVFFERFLCDGAPQLHISTTMEELRRELTLRRQQDSFDGKPPVEYTGPFLEYLSIQRKVADELFDRHVLLFHGSAVAVDGQAYLFIARSGTGKTTHTDLWLQLLGSKAQIVNDDKNFLEISDRVIAHGSPWCGQKNACSNISVPVKAICILERGQTNKIEKISFKDSLFMLLQQSKRPDRNVEKYMELIEKMADKVNFYRLECNTQLSAAQLAYETMSENI